MGVGDCNANILANELFTSLTADTPLPTALDLTDAAFSYVEDPTSPLNGEPGSVTLADLTQVALDGTGVFDKLMASVDLHIQREYESNRITGDQYAQTYTEVMTAVLNTSSQFLLNRDQAKWAAYKAQSDAKIADVDKVSSLVNLEKVKVDAHVSQYTMNNAAAQYALSKMQSANVDAQHCMIKSQTTSEDYKTASVLPAQVGLVTAQTTKETYGTTNTLPAQLAILQEQLELVEEQVESERSKTLDTRRDATTVIGSVGKQKALYTQQIDSFVKDAQYKTAKMYLDAWITQKTLDETLAAPTELQNTAIDAVIAGVRSNNSL